MGELIRIDFACNDPDNGNFDGRVEAIEIGNSGQDIELERWGAPMRLTEAGDRGVPHDHIRFARQLWPWVCWKYGYGNWCWDAYWFRPEVAARLILELRRWRWDCNCAPSTMFDWWRHEPKATDESRLIRWLKGQEGALTMALIPTPNKEPSHDR